MLGDRYYMRDTAYRPTRSLTMTLVIANAVVFLLHMVVARFTEFPVERYLALSLEGLKHGWVWQLVSYGFLHAGLLHLVVNLWAIYVFGNEVEQALGRRSFAALYAGSIAIGGLFQTLAGVLFGGEFAGYVLGASAAAFGLAAAFAVLFPDRILLLFFILPLRAKYLLLIMGFLTLYGLMFPEGHIAHAAHLGGLLCGLGFVRYAQTWTWNLPRLRGRVRFPKLVRIHSAQKSAGPPSRTPPAAEMEGDEDFLAREVDPILDKISASGIQSLTERERRVLEQARAKMTKR